MRIRVRGGGKWSTGVTKACKCIRMCGQCGCVKILDNVTAPANSSATSTGSKRRTVWVCEDSGAFFRWARRSSAAWSWQRRSKLKYNCQFMCLCMRVCIGWASTAASPRRHPSRRPSCWSTRTEWCTRTQVWNKVWDKVATQGHSVGQAVCAACAPGLHFPVSVSVLWPSATPC